jgi:NADH-quinone oxidoreductase subunit F
MPAWEHEINEALAEGIIIHNSWGPGRFFKKERNVLSAEFKYCRSVFDTSGKFSPKFDSCELTTLEADNIVLAIGQAPDLSSVEQENIEIDPSGRLKADGVTGETNLPGVFAGGEVVYGPRIAIDAIAAGKRAAVSIDCYLRGEKIPNPPYVPKPRGKADLLLATAAEKVSLSRPNSPMLPVDEREGNFRQVDLGLTHEMALNEAKRCLRCDRCLGDGLCELVCSEIGIEAIRLSRTRTGDRLAYFDFENTLDKCIGCGSCAVACPHGSIEVNDEKGIRKILFCGTLTAEFALETCKLCGEPFATKKHLELVKERSDGHLGIEIERDICPTCARKTRAMQIAGEIQTI